MVVFRKDPCGIVCLGMTYGAVLYADYVVVQWIVLQIFTPGSFWGLFHILAFNSVVLCLFISHARAVFSDPGIVPLPQNRMDFSDLHDEAGEPLTQNAPPDEDWTICTRCEMYRPPRAHHCRICRRCIRRMDHHCPWINNCVGEWNQKYFIQFLFYVAILSAYSLFLVGFSWYYHGSSIKDQTKGVPVNRELMHIKQSRILHCVLLVLESILFGLFVCAIACDQFDAIFSDETLVEQAKKAGPYRPKKAKMTLLAEVCGHDHPATWIIPCHTVNRRTVAPKAPHQYVV